MTGSELGELSPYDYSKQTSNKTSVLKCTRDIKINDTECFAKEGDILFVEYRCQHSDNIYVRNARTGKLANLCPGFLLGHLIIANKEDAPDNKTIHLKHYLGDYVWFIHNDKVIKGKIYSFNVRYNVYYSQVTVSYQVEIENHGDCDNVDINEEKCFTTKEELLKTL